MKVLHTFRELSDERAKITGTLGLVPTMGALHAGHLSLVDKIRRYADSVMVTIFVNPTQFGAGEDFDRYPRQEAEDLKKLEGLANYVYIPKVEDIYPSPPEKIHVAEVSEGLENDFRPGHFDGVATVVNILFQQTRPDFAIFGEKDFQQLMVIKKMVADRELPVKILSGATLREPDGLAMSSRNVYLTPEERAVAPLLHKYMTDYLLEPETVKQKLEANGFKVQYVAERWERLLAAVYLGKARLIDNIPL